MDDGVCGLNESDMKGQVPIDASTRRVKKAGVRMFVNNYERYLL